ncbi:MAG: agmatine deiminase family protein [Flavobacteriales bacterium]|nr:agmatine deiminase family protein [Flavobacteriales bacterium]
MHTSSMLRSFSILAVAIVSVPPLFAQDLPIGLAPHELPLIREYRDTRAGQARGITTPPAFPVRTMAEWEEVQSVVITWASYTGILKQIVRAAKEECEVIIVCQDPSEVTSVLLNGSYGGPLSDLDGITFLEADYNSIWVRDFGPETIYANEVDSLFLLDWIYNRPRPEDDALSDALGTAKGIEVFSTSQAPYDLVHTGGNFMSDGFGTAFSSELVLEENGPIGEFNQTSRDEAGVDQMMQQFMGIVPGRYVKMQQLLYDNINHIDMHMKLIDEETLLVGEFPLGQSDGPRIEANLQGIINDVPSVFGDPYRVVRVPMPPSTSGGLPPNASYRTYANNVFINGTVLVPTYRTEYDTTGLRILREALPGYNVVGIDCDEQAQNIISASGAIHCITKCIGVPDPLLIRHQRLADTYNTVDPYPVEAYIRHKSGIASAQVYWTIDTLLGYSPVPMTATEGDVWTAALPAQPAGSVVYYYIEATANAGKVQVRPLVAPQGWWRFNVLDLNTSVGPIASTVVVDVFPNPTSSLVMVTLDGPGAHTAEVDLVDVLGRSVKVLHRGPVHADRRVFADLSSVPSGSYLVIVKSQGARAVRPLVKN